MCQVIFATPCIYAMPCVVCRMEHVVESRKCVIPVVCVCETWKIVCSQTQLCHMRCI